METKIKINTIPEALEDLKLGKVIIVVDDENRENEGDFLTGASTITTELVNFMVTHGRGLTCAPLTQKRAEELDLGLMVGNNTDPKQTAFTVSIDLLGNGVTTGISAADRAATIRALVDEDISPKDFARPGHIFPLIAKKGGVLKRDGHTEATVDLLKLAGLPPVGVIVEVLNEDGTMARLPQLAEIAERFNLKIITIEELIAYRLKHDSLIERMTDTVLSTHYGELRMITYKDKTNDQIHIALLKGEINAEDVIPVRVKSVNTYVDTLRILMSGEEDVITRTMNVINKKGKGAIIFINNPEEGQVNETRLNELINNINGKEVKINTKEPGEERSLGIGAQIIKDLGIKKINILTRNPNKKVYLSSGYGVEIVDETQI